MIDTDRPDPALIQNRDDFAKALQVLRTSSSMTVRAVARASNIPYGTVGGYFAGRHLPPLSPSEALPAVLAAVGVTDESQVRAWRAALERVRPTPGPVAADLRPPYRGMESFHAEDAEWFHGRSGFVDTLIAKLAKETLIAIVGPSGAGKSSILQAGLIPRLEGALLMTPSADPVGRLIEALGLPPETAPASVPGQGLRCGTLIVDQFEELFTNCPDEDQREEFVSLLEALTRKDGSALRVVFGLRADFYNQSLRYAPLARALQSSHLLVGPMTAEQLRQVITKPADQTRTSVEDGLVELLLRDLGGLDGGAYEAGALPLLSHALLSTWERGNRRRLTVQNYIDGGGIFGAVAQTANEIFNGLDEHQQEQARRFFLRMIRVGEDTADTRRRVFWSDLADDADSMLYQFVEARLVTVDIDTIEITHDALLHAWPRLREWVDTDRAGRLVGQHVNDAAGAWEREGRDSAALFRGSRLSSALDWMHSAGSDDLSPSVADFLRAGFQQEEAERLAERRTTRRLQQLLAVLSAAVLVAVGFGGYAFIQRSAAVEQRDLAISRQVAIEADRLWEKDPALARQLALAAYRISPTPEARSSVLSSQAGPGVTRAVDVAGVMQTVAVTPDGRTMATAGEGKTIQMWSLGRAGQPVKLGTPLVFHTATIFTLAFSPDGRTLASGAGDGLVMLWDVSDPRNVRPVGTPLAGASSTIYSVAFSPDGRTLVAGSNDKKVYLWSIAGAARRLIAAILGGGGPIHAVTFSPDGTTVAASGEDGIVRRWEINKHGLTPVGTPLTGPVKTVFGLAISPDGHFLAAATADDVVRLWPLGRPGRSVVLTGPASFVNSVAFSPDGAVLAGASSDGKVWLWNLSERRVITTLPHPAPVTSIAFVNGRQEGYEIVTSAGDSTARLWDLPGPLIHMKPQTIYGIGFSRDARILAVAGLDNTAQVWRTTDPRHPVPITPIITGVTNAQTRATGAVGLSPDARLMAVGDNKGSVQLWDLTDPAHPAALPARLTGFTSNVESVVFDPAGRILVVTSDDGAAALWNITDPRRPTRLGLPLSGFTNYAIGAAFAPDGKTLAVSSADHTVRLWNIADPSRPRLLGQPFKGDSSYVYAVAFSTSGRVLVTGGADNLLRLWDVTRPAHPVALGPPLAGPAAEVFSVAFSPDDRTLSASTSDGTTWLWNVSAPRSPRYLATLSGPAGTMFYSDYDKASPILATSGADPTIWLWNTDISQVEDQICATAGAPISRQEWHQYIQGRPYDPPCPG